MCSSDLTLRPCRDKSKDWDTTQNLYIEGDNLEALKILRETYQGKVKLIYIDPPYNTGHDFIYADDFSQSREDYDARSGDYDDEGGRLVANPESNGRFHSDWCSMMYPRLMLARDLLSKDGAIFISIDDCEVANLSKVCNEVFGTGNALAVFHRVTKKSSNSGDNFSPCMDYLLGYARDITCIKEFSVPMPEEIRARYVLKDQYWSERGPYQEVGLFQAALKHGGSTYPIVCPDGERVIPPNGQPWRWNAKAFELGSQEGRIVFKRSDRTGLLDADTGSRAHWNVYTKVYLKEREAKGMHPKNFSDAFQNTLASNELKKLDIPFDFAKPSTLVQYLINLVCLEEDCVLDFFSGSATTAHAVMKQNAEDGGHRKFILVQLPEECAEGSEAYKAGYRTICDIGEERIRRAGDKIAAEVEESNRQLELGAEPKPVPDIGFRVLRVDDSCLKDQRLTPEETGQLSLDSLIDNSVEGTTSLDLLFQVLPAFRIPYSEKIEERQIGGCTVYDVGEGQLLACFDEGISSQVIEAIAKQRPPYAVFRDAALADDATAANLEELFKTYSPDTVRKVI